LSLDPRFTSSNPTEYDEFLRRIKIRSTTSFGGEVKRAVPCKILWLVKEPKKYEEIYFVGKIYGHFTPSFSYFAIGCVCW
jgi:hypothetical protein